jgi:outer membrane protein OmpA-like peptidoglycan-associated protein
MPETQPDRSVNVFSPLVRGSRPSALPWLALPLALAGAVALSSTAAAQPPPGPFDQPPPGGQPPPATFGNQPPPGQPPPGQPPPGQPPPGGGFGWSAEAQFGPPPPAPTDDEAEDEFRKMTLAEGVTINGSTGLLRTAYAGSSAAGLFRVSFLFDWFTANGFLCNADTPCGPTAVEDSASHVGAFFALNATPLEFLEAYALIRTYANANDQSSPGLLQVLGDTTLGLKPYLPFRLANNLTFGADIRLLLLNGAGDVGVSGAGTSAEFMALATSDFRKIDGKGIGAPFRIHFNAGYRVDNSGKLVEDVETLRAQRDPETSGGLARIPVSRIERFGLGINRTDFFQLRLGVDVPWRWVQPYVEYSVDIPVNRQDYECHTRTISPGDVCLALQDLTDPNSGAPGYSAIPSRLSLGARTNPLPGAFRGLSGHLAFDIGLSGTSTFIEEVAPQAPWTLYLGIGYAFDTKEKKEKVVQQLPPPPPPLQLPPPPAYFVRGKVVEKGTGTPVIGAIVSAPGMVAPVATGSDGGFQSHELDPGEVAFQIKADGYAEGTCVATIVPAMAPFGQPGMGQPGMGQPGFGQPGFGQPGMPPPGAPPGGPPMGGPMGPPPQAPSGPVYTEVECELEALPKDGGVEGTTKSPDGSSISGVTVELTDSQGQLHTATTGPDGSFAFPKLALGEAKVKAQANDYMLHVQEITVRPREQTKVTLTLNPRPKVANVRILGNQLQVNKKIFFELNSAKIDNAQSDEILSEIADVLLRNAQLKKVEIQGHTDNTGTQAINEQLSQDRAEAVQGWLVGHGVEPSRLTAKGYGASRPLAPNITPQHRARNRRVQFVILEKD